MVDNATVAWVTSLGCETLPTPTYTNAVHDNIQIMSIHFEIWCFFCQHILAKTGICTKKKQNRVSVVQTGRNQDIPTIKKALKMAHQL